MAETVTCVRCKKEQTLPAEGEGLRTLDVWILDSFLWESDFKTGEQPPELMEGDYLVFCDDCRAEVIKAWHRFVKEVTSNG